MPPAKKKAPAKKKTGGGSPPKGKSNNPSGQIKSVSDYVKKKTKGGKAIIDEMLTIAFGRTGTGKNARPVYEVKERWQALKFLGDFLKGEEGEGAGGTEKANVFIVDFSKVKDGKKS